MPAGRPRTKPFGPKPRPNPRGRKPKVPVTDKPVAKAVNKLVRLTTKANGIQYINKKYIAPLKLSRSILEQVISFATTASTFYAWQFQASDLGTAFAPYASLYGQYKINSVKITFQIKTFGDATNERCPSIYLYKLTDIDTNNLTAPLAASLNPSSYSMVNVQRESCKVLRSTHEHRTIEITVKPFILLKSFTTSIGSTAYQYSKSSKQWCDTLYTTIPNYGLNVYFTDLTVGDIVEYDLQYNLSFRDPK